MKADRRLYMVLVELWSAADIEHNTKNVTQFNGWCYATYGVRIRTYEDYYFDDPHKETLFRLQFADII